MADNLSIWIKHINERPLPIFRGTVSEVSRMTHEASTTTVGLTATILRDPALTSRLLRVASSAMFNRTNRPVTTVSQAVLLLGFNRVREISISLAVLDALIQRQTHCHVLDLTIRSLHAAELAHAIAQKRGDGAPEEVFIASLLYHLGELAFWSVSDKAGDLILMELASPVGDTHARQQALLGTTFDALGLELAKDWHLGPLLRLALTDITSRDPRVCCIRRAHDIAGVFLRGWDCRELWQVIEMMAEFTKQEIGEAANIVRASAREAAHIASTLGAAAAAQRLEDLASSESA